MNIFLRKISMLSVLFAMTATSMGCGITEVVLVVAGDSTVQMTAQNLRIQVLDTNGLLAYDETLPVSEFAFPATMSITPSGSESAAFRVHIAASFPAMMVGGDELRSTRGTSFVEGESVRLDIPLFSRCRGVVCGVEQYCAANAQCESDAVDPSTLPSWTGSP